MADSRARVSRARGAGCRPRILLRSCRFPSPGPGGTRRSRPPAFGVVSLPAGAQCFPAVSPCVSLSTDHAEHCFLRLLAVQIVAFVKGSQCPC